MNELRCYVYVCRNEKLFGGPVTTQVWWCYEDGRVLQNGKPVDVASRPDGPGVTVFDLPGDAELTRVVWDHVSDLPPAEQERDLLLGLQWAMGGEPPKDPFSPN